MHRKYKYGDPKESLAKDIELHKLSGGKYLPAENDVKERRYVSRPHDYFPDPSDECGMSSDNMAVVREFEESDTFSRLPSTTRDVWYLLRAGVVGSDDIGRKLGITGAAVRLHIKRLRGLLANSARQTRYMRGGEQ